MFTKNSQNLAQHLWMRESNWREPGRRHPIPQHFLSYERNFFKSITPRFSVQNVDKPLGYLRKFTPDGRQLVAFSSDQRSLDVYQYQGVGNAASLLEQQSGEFITASDKSHDSLYIRQKLFSTMFVKQFSVQLVNDPLTTKHVLNREFSLFIENGRYVLVASMAGGSIFPSYEDFEEYPDMYGDAELYDYTFYLIDLQRGRVMDSLLKPHDYIILSHNHSVSMYGGTLAILSTYRQSIDVLEVDSSSGKLRSIYTVGPYGSALDRDRINEHVRMCGSVTDHTHSLPLTHLKQKILTFMYWEALKEPTLLLRKEALKAFYKRFGMIEGMLLLKMQLVDSDLLLLRFNRRRPQMRMHINSRREDIISDYFMIYVFYNMTEQKVINIFAKNSTTLLQVLRNFSEEFRNIRSLQLPWQTSSPSNNYFHRSTFDNALNSLPGGLVEAAGHFNPTLPISAQSFSTSPYLDHSLFNYDERSISTLERPRVNCLEPLKFFDRNTGQVTFRLHLEIPTDRRQEYEVINAGNLVAYIFHPYEPFLISIQKFASRYCINFHIYNTKTKVAQ